MKKLIYSFLLFLFVFSTSCDKEEIQTTSFSENLIQEDQQNIMGAKTIIQTECKIDGPEVVAVPSDQNYYYQSNISNSSVQWEILSGNMSFSLLGSPGTHSTRISFGNNFQGGQLRAIGTQGPYTCSDVLTILPDGGTGNTNCCVPSLGGYWICGGWGYGHGAVYISFPDCDRTTVASIDWDINGAQFISGPLTGQSSGTTTGPGSPGNIGGNCEDTNIGVYATIHFNNGCPTKTYFHDIEIRR